MDLQARKGYRASKVFRAILARLVLKAIRAFKASKALQAQPGLLVQLVLPDLLAVTPMSLKSKLLSTSAPRLALQTLGLHLH